MSNASRFKVDRSFLSFASLPTRESAAFDIALKKLQRLTEQLTYIFQAPKRFLLGLARCHTAGLANSRGATALAGFLEGLSRHHNSRLKFGISKKHDRIRLAPGQLELKHLKSCVCSAEHN